MRKLCAHKFSFHLTNLNSSSLRKKEKNFHGWMIEYGWNIRGYLHSNRLSLFYYTFDSIRNIEKNSFCSFLHYWFIVLPPNSAETNKLLLLKCFKTTNQSFFLEEKSKATS